MDHSRKCQVCPMKEAKYQLDWMDAGSDVHLGHNYVRYKKFSFHLWAQHVCFKCKHKKPLNIDTSQKKHGSNVCNMS